MLCVGDLYLERCDPALSLQLQKQVMEGRVAETETAFILIQSTGENDFGVIFWSLNFRLFFIMKTKNIIRCSRVLLNHWKGLKRLYRAQSSGNLVVESIWNFDEMSTPHGQFVRIGLESPFSPVFQEVIHWLQFCLQTVQPVSVGMHGRGWNVLNVIDTPSVSTVHC